MENTDTRIQVTKAIFHKAMLELLEEKAIGFISVKELCERAGLNRGTYYLHYSEPMDVLHEMEENLKSGFAHSPSDLFGEELPELLAILMKKRRLTAVIIGHNGNPAFLKAVRDEEFLKAEPYLCRQYPTAARNEIRWAFDFVFSGCTGLVTAWLQEENPEPAELFARRLSCFCESAFNTLQT